uniref:Uncharacterized protein n=1 Tax=Rhizophora mucronata TaxID=61149 RepID=A0A2P2QZN0_RHIMU
MQKYIYKQTQIIVDPWIISTSTYMVYLHFYTSHVHYGTYAHHILLLKK